MAIDFRDLPDIDDVEFQSYIKRPSHASDELVSESPQHGDYVFDDARQEFAVRRQRSTYASFGDNGTTASVNGYGTIMRLSRYLRGIKNPSKMVGLEFSGGAAPYYVSWRAENFHQELSVPSSGFGLQIKDVEGLQPGVPKMEFLNNRWPQITYSVKGFDVRVRLFCQKGTVIQQFTVTNISASAADLELILSLDFPMYELDYMNFAEDAEMKCEHGPHGHSVIVVGRGIEKENENGTEEEKGNGTSKEVGVLVGLFQNGESEKLTLSDDERFKGRAVQKKYSLPKSEKLELRAAFRLQHLKLSSAWKDFMLPIADVDVSEIMQLPVLALDRWSFPRDKVLSWHLRRNLEHILSVCSIPITRDVSESQHSGDNFAHENEKDHRVTPIALTCGDLGDHRVSVPGSFFAFKYLLSMHEQLRTRLDEDPAARSLRSRIHNTCKGHLQWISELKHDEAFASNFWVDGKILEQNWNTDIPTDCPINMPMHILKATEYLEVFKEEEEFNFVSEWLPSFVRSWIQILTKTKNHLATVWRHISDDSDIATYRLSDHVWIWRALQSIEQLIENVEVRNLSTPSASMEKILELKTYLPNRRRKADGVAPRLPFTADELRKQILRRFTIENDISRKRMLSTTRSARETRFLFHSRDTVFYYGMEWGFFRDDSQTISELWELLVQSQSKHDEGNDELQWENPLRYALALLMGVEDHQFDKNYTPSDMAFHATRVILESSSENGLFPGQMNETTKGPEIFDRELFRDFYFQVGFEIPYILLWAELKKSQPTKLKGDHQDDERRRLDFEGGIKPSEYGKDAKGSEVAPGPSRGAAGIGQPKHQPIRQASMSQSSPVIGTMDRYQLRLDPNESRDSAAMNDGFRNIQSDGRAIQIVRSLKRHMPFGKLMDLSNIVEMSEEWLYDFPRFLNFEPPKTEEAASILKQADGITIERCVGEKAREDDTDTFPSEGLHCFGGSRLKFSPKIIDVPKGKKQRKRQVSEPFPLLYDDTYQDLWSALQRKRTAESAKKRLIYLGPGDCRVAALCYLASPEIEREHISQFFDRHATAREFFIFDDTIVGSNFWETELHISFYQLVKKGQRTSGDFSPIRAVESRRCPSLKEDSLISEAAIGFRIVGDFIDRYWTCHIIENLSNRDEDTFDTFEIQDHEHWQQRKVLELILFQRVLSKARQSADDIIGAIEKGTTKKSAVEEKHLFGSLRFEDRSIEDLQEILQVLVILKNNFASILEIIDLWEDRESIRGQERPRWTRNDEQKYRRTIKRRLALQERCIRDLRNQQARIEFLITLVTSAQEAIRSARSLREAENIRLFTYLTAFFLPVGLSSSLFGMGQIPERNVIITMVITSAIALSLTALLLYCTLSPKFAARVGRMRSYFKDDSSKGLEPKSLDHARTKTKTLFQRLRQRKTITAKGRVSADVEAGTNDVRTMRSLGSNDGGNSVTYSVKS